MMVTFFILSLVDKVILNSGKRIFSQDSYNALAPTLKKDRFLTLSLKKEMMVMDHLYPFA